MIPEATIYAVNRQYRFCTTFVLSTGQIWSYGPVGPIWFGLRELLNAHHRHTVDTDLLKYWERLLREWARAGVWYGLHGDMPLGCLASLNSVVILRNRVASLHSGATHLQETEYPGGALASAKYSIAKRLFIKADRVARLYEARDDVGLSGKSHEFPDRPHSSTPAGIYPILAISLSVYSPMITCPRLMDLSSDTHTGTAGSGVARVTCRRAFRDPSSFGRPVLRRLCDSLIWWRSSFEWLPC